MSQMLALWHQPERNVDTDKARKIYESATRGLLIGTPASPELPAIKTALADIIGYNKPISIEMENDNFILLSINSDEKLVHIEDLALYALNNGLLLYDINSEQIICCCGRVGSSDYVLFHENGRLLDSPAPADIQNELKHLNAESNSHLILEGPNGYVQAVFGKSGVVCVDWDNGDLESRYILKKEGTRLSETEKIFTAFLQNDRESLKLFGWRRVGLNE